MINILSCVYFELRLTELTWQRLILETIYPKGTLIDFSSLQRRER